MNPVKAKDHEDRRADWFTYANINQWTYAAKACLIGIGMLKDEPGIICEYFITFRVPLPFAVHIHLILSLSYHTDFTDRVESEVSRIHPDDVN